MCLLFICLLCIHMFSFELASLHYLYLCEFCAALVRENGSCQFPEGNSQINSFKSVAHAVSFIIFYLNFQMQIVQLCSLVLILIILKKLMLFQLFSILFTSSLSSYSFSPAGISAVQWSFFQLKKSFFLCIYSSDKPPL